VAFRASSDCNLDVSASAGWLGERPCIRITLRNTSDEVVDSWNVMVSAPGTLAGIVDARCNAVAATCFHVTGEGRTRTIPPGGAVTFGMFFE